MKPDGKGRYIEEILNHEEFLQRYVLNRARTHIGGLKSSCVTEAEEAWNRIRNIVDAEAMERTVVGISKGFTAAFYATKEQCSTPAREDANRTSR